MSKDSKIQRFSFGFIIKTETDEYRYLYSDSTYDYVFSEKDLCIYMIEHKNIKTNA